MPENTDTQEPVLLEDATKPGFSRIPHRHITVPVLSLGLSIVLGVFAGYLVATKPPTSANEIDLNAKQKEQAKKQALTTNLKPEDIRDSQVGVILVKPEKEYRKQGSHILKRDDLPAFPIYIISPHIDLSTYEGKHVKIYGVTYDGGTKDWYLEVNKIEEL